MKTCKPIIKTFTTFLLLNLAMSAATTAQGESTLEHSTQEAYEQWLLSLDSTGNPQPESAGLFREFTNCAAHLQARLAGNPPSSNTASEMANLKSELQKPGLNDSREAAVALVLEGNWEQAAEEIARIPDADRTLLDNVIAGYGALSSEDWLTSCRIFQKVDQSPWKSALLLDTATMVSQNPGNPQALLLRCDSLLRARLPAACAKYSSAQAETLSKCPFGFLVRDLACIGSGDFSTARALATSQIAAAPDDCYAPYLLGTVELLQQNPRSAETNFTRALKIGATFFPAKNAQGVAFLLLGDNDNAIEYFNSALSDNRSSYFPAALNRAYALSGRAAALVGRTHEDNGKGLLGGGYTSTRSMFDMNSTELGNSMSHMGPAETALHLQEAKQNQEWSGRAAGIMGWLSLPNISVGKVGVSLNGSGVMENSRDDAQRWGNLANSLASHLNSFPSADTERYKGAILKAGNAMSDVGNATTASSFALGSSAADGWALDLVLMAPVSAKESH
jgi:tetratricopeptide (TPR) repeat protein